MNCRRSETGGFGQAEANRNQAPERKVATVQTGDAELKTKHSGWSGGELPQTVPSPPFMDATLNQ